MRRAFRVLAVIIAVAAWAVGLWALVMLLTIYGSGA